MTTVAESDPGAAAAREKRGRAPVSIDDGELRHLDPRAVTLDRIAGQIIGGVVLVALLGGLSIPVFVAPLPRWTAFALYGGWLVVAGVLISWLHLWPAISHRHKSYIVDRENIEIRRGVVWRKVINVPRSRVQHTDVTQGPLERRFGLGTVVIYTAGTEHSKVDLHGLEHGLALRIRDHLLPVERADAV